MIAGSDEHSAWKMLLDWSQRGRDMKVENPQNLPGYVKSQQEGETTWQWIKRKLWDDTPGRYDTPGQRMRNLEGIHEGLDKVRNSGVLDSKSPLIKAISDPVRFSQTGEGDSKVFIKLLTGELAAEEASEGARAIRRALPLFDPLRELWSTQCSRSEILHFMRQASNLILKIKKENNYEMPAMPV
jgi:hypothetical protein